MYIFDTNVFLTLGHYYPSRFPTIWAKMNELVNSDKIQSVKEVKRELEINSHFEHIKQWVQDNSSIFRPPSKEEGVVVAQIFQKEQYRRLVKRQNLLKGLPVADPFIIAAAKVRHGIVVTQESLKIGGARIPTVCMELGIKCIDLEKLLEYENLKY